MLRRNFVRLTTLIILCPSVSTCFGNGWVGTKVLPADDPDAVIKVGNRVVAKLTDLDWPCVVERERGAWLWIRDAKVQGWVQKTAVLTVDDFLRRAADRLRQNPTPANYNDRGIGWSAKGEYDFAIKDFSEAIRIGEDETEIGACYRNRGEAWLKKGDAQTAIGDLTDGIRRLSLNSYLQHDAYRLRAIAYDKVGNNSAAEADRHEAKRIKQSLPK